MKNLIVGIVMFFSINSMAIPTVEQVYQECIKQHLKYPLVVLSQSIEECGWNYESYNARKRNNLLGLWNSSKQQYHFFKHWSESITYYKEHVQIRHKEGEDYFKFLARIGYAESSLYISNVKQIYKKLSNKYETKN